MAAAVAGRSPGASSVLVGTLVEDSTHAMFLAETPEEEEGEHRTPHQLDISWMAEHTRQVLRLLPTTSSSLGSSSSSQGRHIQLENTLIQHSLLYFLV
jgi:hypothetical protein